VAHDGHDVPVVAAGFTIRANATLDDLLSWYHWAVADGADSEAYLLTAMRQYPRAAGIQVPDGGLVERGGLARDERYARGRLPRLTVLGAASGDLPAEAILLRCALDEWWQPVMFGRVVNRRSVFIEAASPLNCVNVEAEQLRSRVKSPDVWAFG
jgi:hypothetical protein